MHWLNALKVKTKLTLLITLFAVGFALYALVAYSTLNTLKVNGPYYLRIVAGKDVVADVLPPPEYIIESYLTAFRMGEPTNRGSLEEFVRYSNTLRAQYDDRHEHWQKDTILENDQIRRNLLEDSYRPALEFFQIRDTQFIPAVRRGDYKTAQALLHGSMLSAYTRHRNAINDVVTNSNAYNARVEKEANEVIARRTLFLIVLGVIVLGLIGLGLGTGLSRSISSALGETVGALSTTSSEMAATVEQHERTAVLQSAAVHETTTTMDELDASFNQTAEMVKIAANTAQGAVADAQHGLTTVHQTLEGMRHLRSKVTAVSEQISNLSEQTNQIGSITRVVGDLANQTNMLALNAAVEAARAGEHGKGFGVVASEIRKLADESRKSAERINVLVEDIRKATDATVMATEEGSKTVDADIRLAEQAAQAFNDIASSSEATYEAAQQTLLAVPQQVAAVRQVLSAMEDLNRGAKETAEGLGQTKASVESLQEAAFKLKAMV